MSDEQIIFRNDKPLPFWYNLDYRKMNNGDSFEVSADLLGADGHKKILTLAEAQGIELFSQKDLNGNITFWFTGNSNLDNFNKDKKSALAGLWKSGPYGLTLKAMNKKQPFAKWKADYRRKILEELEVEGTAIKTVDSTAGRYSTTYFAEREKHKEPMIAWTEK